MRDFANKRAFVTGTASGIGRALAMQLASEGVYVIGVDWKKEDAEKTLADIQKAGGKGEAHALDVSDRDAFHALAEKKCAEKEGVDIVISCAGVAQTALIENIDYADLEWIMNINFWGMVYGTKAFLRHILEKGEGHIVNVSSVFGLFSVPSQSAYNSAKFAIRGFTEALAHELRETKVIVSSVHPGGVRTNIVRNMRLPQVEDAETIHKVMSAQFDSFAQTPPEKAAKIIIKGMKKGRARILIGGDAVIMDAITRLFPIRYFSVMRGMSWRRRSQELLPSESQITPRQEKESS